MPLESPARASTSRAWMYLLVCFPILTDVIETGGLPHSPREWFTEAAVGVLIALLVHALRREHLALLSLARSDALTGLGNRRAFAEEVEAECTRARRLVVPLTLVLMDLDRFKQVNDLSGHARGDAVLQQFGNAIRRAIREHVDRGFRLGGDEFALLLPGSNAAHGHAVVARIRDHCVRQDPLWRDGPLGISAGIVEFESAETTSAFVARADVAMYGHKNSGGGSNRRP
ncbi:MAG: diguanylate cyclase [Betaproteobacteria bacterium]|nr:diguanylate cyclase [Betaproteobacteria bacterium]